ncbi:MAG: response regulator [Coleofasciculus sp. S288]|nr:response regulator [Coleofasciculus sp. S288]
MKELILIIENNEMTRSNFIEFLEAKNFNIISAGDGASGLQLAKQFHPDLILCEINLPSLSGFGVLKELRRDFITAKTPFIFLTSDSDSRYRAMQLGANDYLTKPVTLNKLLKSITHQWQLVG